MTLVKRILKWAAIGFGGLFLLFVVLVVVAVITTSPPPQEEAVQKADQAREGVPDPGQVEPGTGEPSKALQREIDKQRSEEVSYPDPVRGLTLEGAVDGDTIMVSSPGGSETVRLIGIDTPEECQPLGDEASQHMATFKVSPVTLQFDEEKRGQYDRLLAYVFVYGEMLNARMIRDGYAQVYTVSPNDRYEDRLLAAQQKAKDLSFGFGMDIWSLSDREHKMLADHGNDIGQGDGACMPQRETASPTATASPSPGAGGGDGDPNRDRNREPVYNSPAPNTAPATAPAVNCESGVPAPYPNHPSDGDDDGCINE
jgi:micrococcal nuclease